MGPKAAMAEKRQLFVAGMAAIAENKEKRHGHGPYGDNS